MRGIDPAPPAVMRLVHLCLALLLAVPVASGCAAPEREAVDDQAGGVGEESERITKVGVSGPDDPADQYLLDVTFGKITRARFDELHARFATERAPAYDASKQYRLVDFLPSFAQKTHAKVLVPHTRSPERALVDAMDAAGMANDGQVYVDANCHSVTWQWVNHLQGRGSDDAVLTLVDGEILFMQTEGFEDVRRDALEAGDLYFFKGDGGLDQTDAILHSGVYLGDGLVFEKGNPGERYPYRVAYLADVIAKYERVDANVEVFFRRVTQAPVLKTLSEELSLASRAGELGLTGVDAAILGKYQVQEEFDWDTQSSVYTLGALMTTSAAGATSFFTHR